MTPTPLELLAPAKNADIAIKAIQAGADAIYIGPESHGARRAAANSLDDIRRVVEAAHPYDVRVFATVNTIVYDSELASVERLVWDLYNIGVDALIVQDMGLLRMNLPPIELHASTQCDIRTPEKARFLHSVGFSRVVPARELSLSELGAIHSEVPGVEIEAFIHGALCVSYSGDCRASAMSGGRSANRGECAQICRLPFDLVDASGRKLVEGKHLLSLRDLNRSASLPEMIEAGVTSFKIEGRLKEADYVMNTVAHYSAILDRIVAESSGRYRRASVGKSRCNFTPDPSKAFNRGFTPYFLNGRAPRSGIAAIHTPKAMGERVGTVTRCTPREITARLSTPLANGDGLGYFNAAGTFCGFRLNRVEGDRLFPASPQKILPGTPLYRNKDQAWDSAMDGARCTRSIPVDMVLSLLPDRKRISLELTDVRGISATAVTELPQAVQDAITPQETPRRNILSKLGDTIYSPRKIIDLAGACFIPASALAALRRQACSALDSTILATYRYKRRLPEDKGAPLPAGTTLTIHDNVANALAREFYRSHGASEIAAAVEVERPEGEVVVMTTRYCLRRELGRCLLTPQGREWPQPLWLVNDRLKMRVDFDCKRCGMELTIAKK
ncbi:MAG: U32 family peptidase [Muribaculaceae bacterium]|nr:U32 family peptidase [Muribaculaceae bacterium]